jgi:class 3 adenylate cyclase/tetratricopeptide (TPR) repeat protein
MMLTGARQENSLNIPQKQKSDYSKDAIKKMAVLFTDIVGSSEFFKKNGDIEGRKMLRVHQDLASPAVSEFGGKVVKMLGDSVMAYFLNPEDALKSAIKIQQKFQAYNTETKGKGEIHIRLCVHYGDGIIDDGDIFGDVVNMAAKFLPLASGDEILISRELHSTIKNIPLVRFDNFEVPKSNIAIKDLKLFKVIWDSRIALDPTMKTIVHLRPIFNLGSRRFDNLWNKLIAEKARFWSVATIEKEQINSDRSISLIVKKTAIAYEIAKHISGYLQTNMGDEANLCLPLLIIIDRGAYIIAGKISLNNLKVNLNQLEPGEIYTTETSFQIMVKDGIQNISLNSGKGANGSFFVLSQDKENQDGSSIFRYQQALINGDFTPCFYCGSQSHDTKSCPSKMIAELTEYVDKLGYMPLESINSLFLNYLQANPATLNNTQSINKNDPIFTAYNAFYELKSVFQLRLLRTIWNTKEDNWNKIKINQEESERGGLLWIAFDCLRVSNHSQVESIIESEIKKKNNDYKLYCIAGLTYIENNQLKNAAFIFKKALEIAVRSPEKIYVHFLLYRIYSLSREFNKAREELRSILKLSPHCTEATYFETLAKFHSGNINSAIEQLIKLIRKNRDYYIYALIDPELSHYQKEISAHLDILLKEVKEKAEKLLPLANEELAGLEKIIGKEAEEIIEANAHITKINQLIKTNSFFGYLDVIHYGEDIFNLGNRIVRGRETRLVKIEEELDQLILRCKIFLDVLPYDFMSKPVSNKLKAMEYNIKIVHEKMRHQAAKEFNDTLETMKNYSGELIALEHKLRRMDALAQFLGFLVKFFKKNLVFQSANLIISLLVLPIMVHYLNFIIPNLNLSTNGIWHYQKVLIILGGITGVILSSLTSQKGSSK